MLNIVVQVDSTSLLTNVAEVYAADQFDIDSSPNNDDGDQSGDDEDCVTNVIVEICNNGIDDDMDGLIDTNDPECKRKITTNFFLAGKILNRY